MYILIYLVMYMHMFQQQCFMNIYIHGKCILPHNFIVQYLQREYLVSVQMWHLSIKKPMTYDLGRKQDVENPGGRKDSGRVTGGRFTQRRCDEMDTWYLSTGNQPYGRMQVNINLLSLVIIQSEQSLVIWSRYL